MPLTPEDVRNRQFSPVRRMGQGYQMSEVDQFLDEVETELRRLLAENEQLTDRLATAGAGGAGGGAGPAGGGTPSERAARVLELATRDADELLAESRQLAEKLVSEARAEADRVTREAGEKAAQLTSLTRAEADALTTRTKEETDAQLAKARDEADRLIAQAREHAARLRADAAEQARAMERETASRREQVMGRLAADQADLGRTVDDLRTFEKRYRARLREYFQAQLRVLDSGTEAAGPDAEEPGGSAGQAVVDGAPAAGGAAAPAAAGSAGSAGDVAAADAAGGGPGPAGPDKAADTAEGDLDAPPGPDTPRLRALLADDTSA